MTRHLTLLFCASTVLAACAKEPPPRSVTEFLDNPILLEAALVRCSQDRSKSRYEAECVNARAAVARIQAREEAARAAALEARSESKQDALRRTQAAAAEARRRAAEQERLRQEAEYLAQFGVAPPVDGETADALPDGNLPAAVLPEAGDQPDSAGPSGNVLPATDGGNAPVVESESETTPMRDEEGTD
jgi:hypothetical protein